MGSAAVPRSAAALPRPPWYKASAQVQALWGCHTGVGQCALSAARLSLARCEEPTATVTRANATTAGPPATTDPRRRSYRPPSRSSVVYCRASCGRLRRGAERRATGRPTGTSGRPTGTTDRNGTDAHKRIAEVTGPCLRPPQRTPPPPTYTPARSLALCCRALVPVRLRPARARLRVCAYSTEPTPLAACLAGGHAGARRSRARGRTCERERRQKFVCSPGA